MTPTTPRFAKWLLDTFAAGTNHDNLAGDITERYSSGRHSRGWYLRQVLVAIATAVYRETDLHVWFCIRALFVGWSHVFAIIGVEGTIAHWIPIKWVFRAGWMVPEGVDLYILISGMCLAALALGWLMGRIYGPKVTLLFVASLFFTSLPVFILKAITSWSPQRFLAPAFSIGTLLLAMLCILAGSVLSRPDSAQQLEGERA